jgi:hypothetical protein
MVRFHPSTVVLMLLCAAPQARAQEPATRAESLRQQREAKQGALAPYEPTGLERAMHLTEDRIVPLLNRDGVYARLGSLATSSGFAYGAGFRKRALVDGAGSVTLWGAASLKRYWAIEARGAFPLVPDETIVVEAYGRRYSYPGEEFFGTGPDSARRDRSDYNAHGGAVGGTVTARPLPALALGTSVEYLWPRTGTGANGSLPPVEEVFPTSALPGFLDPTDFLRSSAFVEVDYREPLNARKGGWYRLSVARHDDRTDGRFTFTRTDVDLRQYVSFLSERRVLAGRAFVATTEAAGGSQVPFYLLPALGGNDTLRGFRALRFRGPHALLLQGEYRFEIWSGLDGALFYDAGKVALRRSDLDLKDLERDYGFGFRFNTDNGVIVRFDAAFGSRDGRHLHVVFGGIF